MSITHLLCSLAHDLHCNESSSIWIVDRISLLFLRLKSTWFFFLFSSVLPCPALSSPWRHHSFSFKYTIILLMTFFSLHLFLFITTISVYIESACTFFDQRLTGREAQGHAISRRIEAIKLLERILPLCQVQQSSGNVISCTVMSCNGVQCSVV